MEFNENLSRFQEEFDRLAKLMQAPTWMKPEKTARDYKDSVKLIKKLAIKLGVDLKDLVNQND